MATLSRYFRVTNHTPNITANSPTFLENLFLEYMKMSTTLQSVATDVSTIKETTTKQKTTVAVMQERLTEAETRICLP